MARLLAVVAAIAPALVGLAGIDAGMRPWLVIACGIGLGALVHLRARQAALMVGLGAVLATVAGLFAFEAQRREAMHAAASDAPHVDLAAGPLGDPVPEWIEMRGYFHQGWVLDEYAVVAGDRPDQSTEAAAVLVPFVGRDDDVIALDGVIVIARVQPARAKLVGPQTIRGHTRPAPPEVLGALVQVAGVKDPEAVHGVIVDTLADPPSGRPWLHFGMAAFAVLAALVAYSRAVARGASPRTGSRA